MVVLEGDLANAEGVRLLALVDERTNRRHFHHQRPIPQTSGGLKSLVLHRSAVEPRRLAHTDGAREGGYAKLLLERFSV
jgi:hypothetical protein